MSNKKPIIIGHRGTNSLYKENTLQSIKYGLELNLEMMEIDIQLCKSNEIIVYHNLYLPSGNLISDLILSEILKEESDIPTLNQVLDSVNKKCKLYLDLKENKNNYTFLKILLNMLEYRVIIESWSNLHFILSSYNQNHLLIINNLKYKTILNNIPTTIILSGIPYTYSNNLIQFKPTYIALNYESLTKGFIRNLKKNNIKIFVYTINNPQIINKYLENNIYGIITDNPELFIFNKEIYTNNN